MSRRTLARIGVLAALWVAAVNVARALAPRLDSGDDTSPAIRRAVVAGELKMPSLSEEVRDVHLDLALAGAELGWRPAQTRPGTAAAAAGLDLTVHAKMAGLQVTVPRGTRVWWQAKGPGGVDLAKGSDLTRVDSPESADLRLRAVLVFAGVSIKTA